MDKTSTRVTLALIALGALSRLLPHPPNVTPLAAMALLGGARLPKRLALLAPLAALFLSDLVLGLHSTIPFVYGCFLATAWLGITLLSENRGATRVGAACLASSLLFFIVTNFGVWLLSGMYPHSAPGLAACYTAAIPFFRNSILGDLGFTAILFGFERLGVRLLAPAAAAA